MTKYFCDRCAQEAKSVSNYVHLSALKSSSEAGNPGGITAYVNLEICKPCEQELNRIVSAFLKSQPQAAAKP